MNVFTRKLLLKNGVIVIVAMAYYVALPFLPSLAPQVYASNDVTPGTVTLEPPTFHSLGIEWDITNDDDRDATVTVQYRELGTTDWQDAMNLHRMNGEVVAWSGNQTPWTTPNKFAGSILNLQSGISYEVQLTMTDPDGGGTTYSYSQTTRKPMRSYEHGTTHHVYPSGYSGTEESPNYDSITEAVSAAVPGDTVLIHNGEYSPVAADANANLLGDWVIALKGTAEKPITIRGESKDGVILSGGVENRLFYLSQAEHLIIENMTLRDSTTLIYAAESNNITIRNMLLKETVNGIWTANGTANRSESFIITDNELIGNQAVWYPYSSPGSTYGLRLAGAGHVVSHNKIHNFWDGLSINSGGNPSANPYLWPVALDFDHNEVYNMIDDCMETDGGVHNFRIHHNLVYNCLSGISVQPFYGGPDYIYRNIVYGTSKNNIKFNVEPAGIYLFNNTLFAGEGSLQSAAAVANSFYKNNLFLGTDANASYALYAGITTPTLSEMDYNGYYIPVSTLTYKFLFNKWTSNTYSNSNMTQIGYTSLAALAAGTGRETHGKIIDYGVFENVVQNVVGSDYRTANDYRLKAGSVPIDAGTEIPQITDGYTGSAPDMGALEYGDTMFEVGIRASGTPEDELDDDSITQTAWTDDDYTSWYNQQHFASATNADLSDPDEITVDTTNWYDANWTYRKKIMVDNSFQDYDLTDFPVMVKLTAANFDFSHTKSDGSDIRFTTDDGTTLLPFELDYYNQSESSGTFWVKISAIDGLATENIYVYYGNAGASAGESPTTVWANSRFKAIYHLNDSAMGDTRMRDSKGDDANKDFTPGGFTGSNGSSLTAAGLWDKAVKFVRLNNNRLTAQNRTVMNLNSQDFAFLVLMKRSFASLSQVEMVINKGSQQASEGGYRFYTNSPYLNWTFANKDTAQMLDYQLYTPTGAHTQWQMYSFSFNDTSNVLSYFQGYNVVGTKTVGLEMSATDTNIADTNFGMGGRVGATLSSTVDEVWALNSTIDESFVRAAHRNFFAQMAVVEAAETAYSERSQATLTSSIYDTQQSSDWGVLSYSATAPDDTTAQVKVRTSNNADMSGATDFSSCSAITSGAGLSSNSCVTNGHRYAQYQVVLTADGSTSPTLNQLALGFSESAEQASSGSSNSASVVGLSSEQCTAQPPGQKAPHIYKTEAKSSTSILLYFAEGDDPANHYTLEFGNKSGEYIWGAQNIGGKGTRTYLVQSLAPNTTYYFRLRSMNDCAAGPWSGEASGTTRRSTSSATATASSQEVTQPMGVNEATGELEVIPEIVSSPSPQPSASPSSSQKLEETKQSSSNNLFWIAGGGVLAVVLIGAFFFLRH